MLRRDRHADDRQDRLRGEHPRQVRGPARTGHDHLYPPAGRLFRIAVQEVRRTVGRDDPQLVGDPELGQQRGGLLEDREVRPAPADDPDPRPGGTHWPWALVKASAPSKTWSFSTWVQPGWLPATRPWRPSRSASSAAPPSGVTNRARRKRTPSDESPTEG